jgi:hypothetical protein
LFSSTNCFFSATNGLRRSNTYWWDAHSQDKSGMRYWPGCARLTCSPPTEDDSLFEWWTEAKRNTPKPLHKALASTTLLVPWMIWKHRNDCVFDRARPRQVP